VGGDAEAIGVMEGELIADYFGVWSLSGNMSQYSNLIEYGSLLIQIIITIFV